MELRRVTAGLLTVVSTMAGILAMSAPIVGAANIAQLPTPDPANYTPNVTSGEVDSIWQVGQKMIIGGTFTTVANATSNGGASYNRSRLAAFNATTGVVDTGFAPVFNGPVTTVVPASDGTTVYVGGNFSTVNGVTRNRVARINVSDGSLVPTFNAGTVSGNVRDMRLVGTQLYIGGVFTAVGGQARQRLASIDPGTGAVTTKMNLTFAGTQNGGTTNVFKMETTPAGDRLMVIGNFAQVGGQDRRQIAMIDLSTTPATVSPWATTFYTSTCAGAFDAYIRDLDISEDGSFAVVSTTGAYRSGTSCDTIARFPVYATQAGLNPTWINYTGGDTSYAVEIHSGVAYVGGHQRWFNNPYAGDAAGEGAIPRQGIAALDVTNGLPYSWNPGRDRGVGVFDFHVTSAGLWAGSDTDRWAGELRQKLAFFPWAGGVQVPESLIAGLPGEVYMLGRTAGTTGTDPSVLYRVNAGGPALPSVDDGPGWEADSGTTSAYRNTGSSVTTNTSIHDLTTAVPASETDRPPANLWSTERNDPTGGNEMQWSFPVAAGTAIQVRLYMGNKCTCTDENGQRVFDVDLDGVNVINDLDLTASVGHDVGTMRSFNVTSDGTVNIDFRHVTDNPLINGIEIIRRDISNVGSLGQQDETWHRTYSGTGAPGATTTNAGTVAWRTVRGAFMVNDTLFTVHADGTFLRRTFNGSFTAGTPVAMYGNNIINDGNSITGIFFDPATNRIYYTLTGNSALFYRYFTPQSNSVGATRFNASGAVAALNPTRVRGMFLSGGNLYFGDNGTGNLLRIPFAAGAPSGTASVADGTVDWRSRAMFLDGDAVAPPVNNAPTAGYNNSCTVLACTFTSTSTDGDGTITGSAWNFGDGATANTANASHSYAAAGTYNVSLTVTDNGGATNTITKAIVVSGPGNVAPTAAFTQSCNQLSCTFTNTSTDSDGTVNGFAWNFGDGGTANTANPAHAFAAAGTYTVTLTVTDDDGATDGEAHGVTVATTAAAIGFRASATANTSGTNASIVVPAAVQPGDQMLLFVTANVATTITTPAGWTLLGTQQDGSPDMVSWVFRNTAAAGTAGSTVSATLGASGKSTRVLVAYSGAAVPTVIASAVQGASSAGYASPPVAVATSGSIVVSTWSDKTAASTGWTLPASVTGRAATVGTGSGRINTAVGDTVVAGASWPGATATSSVAGAKGVAWSVVLPPA
jgi:PKD repeat protein